jgi:hypothetical protein
VLGIYDLMIRKCCCVITHIDVKIAYVGHRMSALVMLSENNEVGSLNKLTTGIDHA